MVYSFDVDNITYNTTAGVTLTYPPVTVYSSDINITSIPSDGLRTVVDTGVNPPITYTVVSISDNAFDNRQLLSGTIQIGEEVVSIGNSAFAGGNNDSNLQGTLTIPGSVKSIGASAFFKCSNFQSLTISDGVTSIGEGAFCGCTNLQGTLIIPVSVKSIGQSAFSGCQQLTSLTILDGVTSIGDLAFGPSTFGNVNFNACYNLTGALMIPNTVTSIGVSAFSGCQGLNGLLTLSNGLKFIGDGAFNNCSNLTGALMIPSSVTSIGRSSGVNIIGAFRSCLSLNGQLTFNPNSNLTSIGDFTFSNCSNLTGALTIPTGVSYIGENAFNACAKITALTIPASVTQINNLTCSDCVLLETVTFEDSSLTYIGESAFFFCGKITTITIPASVTHIGQSAFSFCALLSNYIFLGDAPTSFGSNIFDEGPDPAATIDYTIGNTTWNTVDNKWPPVTDPPYTGTRLATVAVCLLKNTKVLMADNTYGNIQDIKAGEYIRGAFSGLPKQIKSVSHQRLYYDALNANNMPCKIPKHFFAALQTPTEDVYMSGGHSLLYKDADTIQALWTSDIVPNCSRVDLVELGYIDDLGYISYYHLDIDDVDGMVVGGMPVETRDMFKEADPEILKKLGIKWERIRSVPH